MVGTPFHVRGGEPVSYCVGNPMGALSSWATFALAHHFVVFVACRRAKVKWLTSRYVLLGDDILIGDARVGRQYMRILDTLGLDYSPSKTYITQEMCEFAKRILVRGEEVTPFPISSISENPWSIPMAVSAIRGEERKGYRPLLGIPQAVRSLQETSFPSLGKSRGDVVEKES